MIYIDEYISQLLKYKFENNNTERWIDAMKL